MTSMWQKAVQRAVQRSSVRVISSELDRRAVPIEQAIRDLHARVDEAVATSQATSTSTTEALRSIRPQLEQVASTQERLAARLTELTERVRQGEDVDRDHLATLEQLRFDMSAAQSGIADVTGVLERLTQSG